MPDTLSAVLYSMLCVYVGGSVKGLTGFGFSLVAVASLVLVAPPSLVIPVVLLMNSLMNVLLVYSVRKEIHMGRVLPLALGGLAGLPLGTYVLVTVYADLLRIVIGLVILLFAAALLAGFRREFRRERLGSAVVGVASGILNGGLGIGGPPVVIFLSSLGFGKSAFRANLVAYFLCINLCAIPFYYAAGLLTAEVLRTFVLLLPALALGGLTGTYLLGRTSETAFRRITLAIVMATALLAVLTGLRGLL